MSKTKRDEVLKNNAVTALFNIINNPINLREAQSSVDVLTKTAKALAKQSEKIRYRLLLHLVILLVNCKVLMKT